MSVIMPKVGENQIDLEEPCLDDYRRADLCCHVSMQYRIGVA